MGATAAIGTAIVGTAISTVGQVTAGSKAQSAGVTNAGTIASTGELNAQLIEQGAELNAGVDDFNAAALEGQATDAITAGAQQETLFRQQIKGVIGSQRASYAGGNVDVSSGSALEVQEDTAKQGELDALQIRTNAARTAWGYTTQAQGDELQAAATRKLGALQAANTRAVAAAEATNARMGGNITAAASNWGAASTIATGASTVATLAKQYGIGS